MNIFFDKLYYIYYSGQQDLDNEPEVMPVVTISFCQCSNLFTLVILLFYFTSLKQYGVSFLVISFIILLLITVSLNFYYYIINKKGKEIIGMNFQITNLFKVISFVYRATAFFLPVLLIYWFQNKM